MLFEGLMYKDSVATAGVDYSIPYTIVFGI